MSTCGNLTQLPHDLLICIIRNLSIPDLIKLSQVARIFRLCSSDKVWKSLCQKKFSKYCPAQLSTTVNEICGEVTSFPSYRSLYRDLEQAHKLQSSAKYPVFDNKEPKFCRFRCLSLIYPVPIFVVVEGGHSIFVDIHIERISQHPFLVLFQSQRKTILGYPVPSIGDDIPRIALDTLCAQCHSSDRSIGIVPNDQCRKILDFYNFLLPRNELIPEIRLELVHESYLPQLLAQAKEKGYQTTAESSIPSVMVRKRSLVMYHSLFHFTRYDPSKGK